jgi:hypothetical protein
LYLKYPNTKPDPDPDHHDAVYSDESYATEITLRKLRGIKLYSLLSPVIKFTDGILNTKARRRKGAKTSIEG